MQVCEELRLTSATAGLAVSYFDRFLSTMSKTEGRGLEKHRVHLLAVTCTRLAAKFAEVKMPSLGYICEAAQGMYTKAQLNEMELEALRVLRWELHTVTPHAALEQLAIILHHDNNTDEQLVPHAVLEQLRLILRHAAEFFVDLSCYVVR